ncbi:MAG TPA: response regulator [Bacteroidia bacterium]|nr:response regulator [Bacteroidia bacterium]
MKSVLVIEDNLELRENTAELLELAGYQVFTAENGKTGFEQALYNHPDVIVCDIAMPVWDGSFFLQEIKKEDSTKEIPLIFFSAGSAPPAIRRDIEAGGSRYISKPFSNDELLNAVAA